jgi:two-component system cell cycle response regulator
MICPEASNLDQSSCSSPDYSDRDLQGHVLVVVDNPAGCRLIRARLVSNGHRVTSCRNPKQAQTLALAEQPDVIICDISMPELDGIEFTRWVRQQEWLAQTPVLLVTSPDDVGVLTRDLEAGADDFLSKPINSVELKARIKRLLGSRHVVRELELRSATFIESSLAQSVAEQQTEHVDRRTVEHAQVLLIDDDNDHCRLLTAYPGGITCDVHSVSTGQAGLAWLNQHKADLVITGVMLPDLDGYQIIEQIRQQPRFEKMPVLAIGVLSEVDDRVKTLDLGADDFILKGFTRAEFHARIERILRLKAQVDKLIEKYTAAEKRAVTDSLTGLVTHRYFSEMLARELHEVRHRDEEHSVIVLGIDHFNAFTDWFSHAIGDKVLQRAANIIESTVRGSGTLSRFGEWEFVISLPRTDRSDVAIVAERIRQNIESMVISIEEGGDRRDLRVTASLGIATFPHDATVMESLLQRADGAMYAARQAGRNCVVPFDCAAAAIEAWETECVNRR